MQENKFRKQRLLQVAEKHMGYQEYTTLLNEIDKQIEQAFLARSKSVKAKVLKKKVAIHHDNVAFLIQNRKKLIKEVGVYFPASKFGVPSSSIYSSDRSADE